MIVYAESSAILAWLLGESREPLVRAVLDGSDRVVTSSLTAVECARGLTRARLSGRITAVQELALLHLLDRAESSWDVHAMDERVLARARAPWPLDPVRTLDALHVSTALTLQDALGALTVLSFDDRIRGNAMAVGLATVPTEN